MFGVPLAELDSNGHLHRPSSTKAAAAAAAAQGQHLHSYQLEGLNWLLFNYFQDRGSVLADEMGLGEWRIATLAVCELVFGGRSGAG